jgi:hypothetical protein
MLNKKTTGKQMKSIHPVKDKFNIAFGGLEIIAASTFLIFAQMADKEMGKDGIGDLATYTFYNRVAGISFYCFFICMMLAIIGFLVGKTSFREIIKPIVFPASLPILWVPFAFFAVFIASLIL